MTQRERVLKTLEAAGSRGVRSDVFIAGFMPRAAARIQELKEAGYAISSEREGKFVRWTLNAGVESEATRHQARKSSATPDSGVEAGMSSATPPGRKEDTLGSARSSMYDPWEDAA